LKIQLHFDCYYYGFLRNLPGYSRFLCSWQYCHNMFLLHLQNLISPRTNFDFLIDSGVMSQLILAIFWPRWRMENSQIRLALDNPLYNCLAGETNLCTVPRSWTSGSQGWTPCWRPLSYSAPALPAWGSWQEEIRRPADENVAEVAAVGLGAHRNCSAEAAEDFAAGGINPVTTGCLPGFHRCPGSARSRTRDMKQRFVYARIKVHLFLAYAVSYFAVLQISGIDPRIKIHHSDPSTDRSINIFRTIEQVVQSYRALRLRSWRK
jgi:hypothetical protein